MRSGQLPDVFDAQPGRHRRAVPAGERRLIVLGVDCLGDQLGLDAFEVFGADAVLLDIGDHVVDRLLDLRECRRRLAARPIS